MSFRRQRNRHDDWLAVVESCPELRDFLVPSILGSEKNFRGFVTYGHFVDEAQGTVRVSDLTVEQLECLWIFINHKAHFDMDASLFDAFNTEFRERFAQR